MPNIYVTVQNMIDGLGSPQLARILDVDESSFDFLMSSMLAQKVAAANSLIDQYVGAKIQVPLSEVPAHFIEYGVAIANWFLVASRPEVQRDGDETRYNQAISYLKDRKGTDIGSVTITAGARVIGSSGARAVGATSTSTHCEQVRILDPCVIPPDGRI